MDTSPVPFVWEKEKTQVSYHWGHDLKPHGFTYLPIAFLVNPVTIWAPFRHHFTLRRTVSHKAEVLISWAFPVGKKDFFTAKYLLFLLPKS